MPPDIFDTIAAEPPKGADIFDQIAATGGGDIFDAVAEPGALERFATGAVEEAKGLVKGLLVDLPLSLLPEKETGYIPGAGTMRKFVVEPAAEMFRKSGEAIKEGRYSEAAGYGLAGALPMLGPAAASIGEQAGEGDIAGAAGRVTTLAAVPLVPKGVKALRGKAAAKPTVAAETPKPTAEPVRAAEPAKPSAIDIFDQVDRRAPNTRGNIQEWLSEKKGITEPLHTLEAEAQATLRGEYLHDTTWHMQESKFAPGVSKAKESTPKGTIPPELIESLAKDVQTIRETGTISEGLKPASRTAARETAAGQRGPAELATERTRADFVAAAEQLSKISDDAKANPGNQKYSAALEAAGKQLELAAEEFLVIGRRDPAMAMNLLQQPVRSMLTPQGRQAALKHFQESGLPRTERMIELLGELKPGYSDMFYEAWVNGLLSGPPTHAVNLLSNLTHRLTAVPERGIAGGIDFLRAKLTGTPQERFAGEMAHDIYGMTAGMQDGIRQGLRAFVTETPQFGKTRIEAARPKAIPGVAGQVIRTPGRLLLAADEMAKASNYSASIHAQAYRAAAMEGKTGAARAARIQQLAEKPTEAMVEAAQTDAIYRTFQQELGPAGQTVASFRRFPGVRYVLPFLRTILNLPKVALEHTPLNFARIAYKNVIQKHPDFKGGAMSEQLAKPVMGTMVGYMVYDLASRGYITGSGPSDPNERRVWLEMYKPNSVKVGNEWVEIGRLDPFSTHFAMAADLAEAKHRMDEGQFEEAVNKMVFSFTQNITSRTWATGLSDALNAVTEPDRYGPRWIQRFAGSMVPTGVAQIARAQDPSYRRVTSVGEAIKARIPGLAADVEPLRGIFGDIIPNDERGAAERMVSPFQRTSADVDAATQEVVRLKMRMGQPARQITIGGKQREMTREEYGQYVEQSGAGARAKINRLAAMPEYLELSDEQKSDMIRDIFRIERDQAKKRIVLNVLRTSG